MRIHLAADERLARAFFRTAADDEAYFSVLRSTDFERRLPAGRQEESGISMFRLSLIQVDDMLARIVGKPRAGKLLGYAVCKASRLLELSLQFVSSDPSSAHVSVRCSECNMDSGTQSACETMTGACPLRKEQLHFSEQLIDVFQVQMHATAVTSLVLPIGETDSSSNLETE